MGNLPANGLTKGEVKNVEPYLSNRAYKLVDEDGKVLKPEAHRWEKVLENQVYYLSLCYRSSGY